ncbi:MAG: hypothetical protein QM503_02255 [Bacteroidota bacterium]
MKKLIFLFNMVVLSSAFHYANSQTLVNGYYIGKEKYNIIETYYYLLTINDSDAHLELYLVSKGQTSSTSLFIQVIKKPSEELFKINKTNKILLLTNNFGNSFKVRTTNDIVLISNTHKVVLEKVQEVPDNFKEMKNLSFYTFANFYPHLILGYKNKFTSNYEIRIRAALRQSDLWDECKQLKYSEYEILIHDKLKEFVTENQDIDR